ncbi:hypothetical protein F1B92_05270 [Campylobacter sp. FMV-PI01]|uniref:SHOCT domain-containing protein n=1 Tax=Campylobacter portucalensis TaxID=2608384 RepID=A0A6L5WHL3_9BACT|nr:SHOCT domain-containing protein [Campylobacter portucalensis]MSN96579.1 hypothetical protein [Campylobacter portucalensis]
MKRNVFIAYILLIISFPIGGGLHRIYCGKIFSGLCQMALFWLGQITVLIWIGWAFLFVWVLWWLADIFLTSNIIDSVNFEQKIESEISQNNKIKNIEALYELYQKGAISKSEYEARKDIIMRS